MNRIKIHSVQPKLVKLSYLDILNILNLYHWTKW